MSKATSRERGGPVMVGKAIIKDQLDAPKKEYFRSKGTSSTYRMERGRVVEIEKLIHHRHGSFVDTDDQITYAETIALHLREANSIRSWCLHYCPGLNVAQMRHVIAQGVAPRRLPTADEVAAALGVTMAERTALSLRTIGAVDCPKEERKALAAEAKRERDRERVARKRRSAGVRRREDFERESVAAEARRLGVNRRTIYKRRAKMAKKAQPEEQGSHVSPHIKTTSMYMERHTWAPAAPSRPRGVPGVTLMAIRAVQHLQAVEGGVTVSERVAASLKNRGHRDWRAQLIRNAQALIAAGVDPIEPGDPNVIFEDEGPSAA